MFSLINSLFGLLDRFERWFGERFGWFFTNGMKEERPHPRR